MMGSSFKSRDTRLRICEWKVELRVNGMKPSASRGKRAHTHTIQNSTATTSEKWHANEVSSGFLYFSGRAWCAHALAEAGEHVLQTTCAHENAKNKWNKKKWIICSTTMHVVCHHRFLWLTLAPILLFAHTYPNKGKPRVGKERRAPNMAAGVHNFIFGGRTRSAFRFEQRILFRAAVLCVLFAIPLQ